MGASPWSCPSIKVTLTHAFYIGRTEVTQAQWQEEMGDTPSFFVAGNGYPGSLDRPVEQVSWNTIQGFLSQNSLRLPTEAEWEYACRAGTTTPFYNGSTDDNTLTTLAWFDGNNPPIGTKQVATKLPNALGLYDMLGNVWELLSDRWESFYPSASPVTNPQGPISGSSRVLRGGSWNDNSYYCRASTRYGFPPYEIYYDTGFRVAKTP